MNVVKTRIHTYQFYRDRRAEYVALAEQLAKTNGECFCTWNGAGSHCLGDLVDGAEVWLETEFLWGNQWNTSEDSPAMPGHRVFDWAEDYDLHRSGTRQGHWLEITDEMREIRNSTVKCGYCGHQQPDTPAWISTQVFCDRCMDSPYLTEANLHLLRLKPISDTRSPAPLTDEERAFLLPIYKEAQIHGSTERGKARLAKQRADILSKAEETIANAQAERDGMLWLMDRGVSIDNVIFYNHTGKFGFGWRKPITGEVRDALLEELREFPYDYEVK